MTPWWQAGTIYQVYPRSFQDSDGDGVGDLKGIEARLDHLVALGVDAIWLSPIFPSPMADFGYDVADYRDVDPRFGTLADFDDLLGAAHARGLKLLLDFVPNHSSDQHPWFQESRSSRDNPKRDWYIWRDAKPDGSPPNNWISDFGGSAWDLGRRDRPILLPRVSEGAARPQLAQPRSARGDDGRVALLVRPRGRRVSDRRAVAHDQTCRFPRQSARTRRTNPAMGEMHRVLQHHSTDQPEVHDIAAEMRRIADGYPGNRVLIGEIYLPVDRLMDYYGTRTARACICRSISS